MNYFYQTLNCLVFIFALFLASCGYLSDKPPANLDVFKANELQACKIDVSKLSEIFKLDQKDQIRCLQENFIQFTKYVRSKNPGSVSETELNAFIRKFFEGQSDSIVKGLSLIFQLNMLLLKDEADRISRNNISPLFDLLVHVNQEAVTITEILTKMDDEKNQGHFWALRSEFTSAVTRFSDFTTQIIDRSPGLAKKLNIKDFILEASNKLGTKEINPQTIDTLIFLKRVLVAGDKEVITSDELKILIQKLPQILTLSFDIYYVQSTNFSSDSDHARFYLKSLEGLYDVIQFDQEDFELFSLDQILTFAQEFIKDKDLKKFKPSVIALKSRVVGGAKETVSLKDVKSILDISKDIIERGYFNNITYNAYRETLELAKPIITLPQLNLPNDYDIFSMERVSELHSDFQDVAFNIRYFRSKKEGVPSYGIEYKRNKFGFIEATMIKWGTAKLLKNYGHKNAQGEWQVSLTEFQTFLSDMKPILEEFKLWSPNPETFARNAVLLADLFQNKSNGDLVVNNTEATEYVQMILSAVEITKKFNEELSSLCAPGMTNEEPVYETACFNENFFETLLNRAKFRTFFPRLSTYIASSSKQEVIDYLKGVEGFARDINDPKQPINNRDTILIIGAMLNIESTLIRFDANNDNLIDNKTKASPRNLSDQRSELEVAFEVYKNAIISIADLRPNQEKYAYSIFLYMIKNMQIPPASSIVDNAKFLYFHYWESTKFIAAKRLNIGSLLFYLVNQGGSAPKDKKLRASKSE